MQDGILAGIIMIGALAVVGIGAAIAAIFAEDRRREQPHTGSRKGPGNPGPPPPPTNSWNTPNHSTTRQRPNTAGTSHRDNATNTPVTSRKNKASNTTGTFHATSCNICHETPLVRFWPCGDSYFCAEHAERYINRLRDCPLCEGHIIEIKY